MFDFLKKKIKKMQSVNDAELDTEMLEIKIDGMHCTSCSMNVDGELEDLDGVISASTSYAQSKSVVEFDPQKVSRSQIENVIKNLGYKIG